MSNCSTNAMSAPKPIHGEIVWKDGMRPTPLSYARYVNGVERVADHIDFDGERYVPERECEFVGDAKYPPKCSTCGWQAGIYDCEWLEDGEYEYDGNFCKQCGARIRKAVKR